MPTAGAGRACLWCIAARGGRSVLGRRGRLCAVEGAVSGDWGDGGRGVEGSVGEEALQINLSLGVEAAMWVQWKRSRGVRRIGWGWRRGFRVWSRGGQSGEFRFPGTLIWDVLSSCCAGCRAFGQNI